MYLLDSQQVMDLFSRDQTRQIFRWLNTAQPGRTEMFVSVLSLGQIAGAIEDMDAVPRNHWRRLYQEGRRIFDDAGGIIDVDGAIVDVWQANLRGNRLSDIPGADDQLGEDDRLIFATAIARGYALVTEASPILSAIAQRTTLTTIEL